MEFPSGFWDSPIWKEAARAGLRRISQMVSTGNLAGASRLAKTPGVLKPSAAGSQIKHLGRGAEGLATMVAHPQHGVAVRKLYDPKGISTAETIARKEIAGKVRSPHVSDFYGSAPAPSGKSTMHFSELVTPQGPKPAPAPGSAQEQRAIRGAKASTILHSRKAGFHGAQDVRRGNMVWDGQSGRFKTIDYIPSQKGEFHQVLPGRKGLRVEGRTLNRHIPENRLTPTQTGSDRLFQNPSETPTSDAELLRTHLGRKPAGTVKVRPTTSPAHAPTIAQGTVPSTPRARRQAPAPEPTRMIRGGAGAMQMPTKALRPIRSV